MSSLEVNDKDHSDYTAAENDQVEAQHRGWRFYMIFVALSITAHLSSIEATIISTALYCQQPQCGNKHVWISNAYFLNCMMVQPLYGQLANIWGRRWPMISSGVLLILGSATCGWATSSSMLIADRSIQEYYCSSLLPAIQAALSDDDAAASAVLFAIIRSFGTVWGITIPVAIFNNQFNKLLYRIQNSTARATLSNGQAYKHATRDFISALSEPLRSQIIVVYSDALKTVW
ncbi:hypothetical protein HYALB_00007774 [Hymenoscyphus albidus]|uniref:Uncharacterized protein n=1 Tax=Hymenoscyphus albidus TaxID=595503 RepID=A0A9N9LQC5_9HELO|nr:hypothetical protein HYALB_00007774 [Hymenoscyphus albidus]